MKRDMELIIKILKCVEEYNTATNNIVVELDGYDTEEQKELVQYHVKLLIDAGYLRGKGSLNPYEFYVREMTWEGHEFLDAARSDTVLNKAKETAKSKGLDFANLPLELAKGLLVSSVKSMLGLS